MNFLALYDAQLLIVPVAFKTIDKMNKMIFLLALMILISCSTKNSVIETAPNDLTESAPKEWELLFNGKDLSNWTIACADRDKNKTYWKVDDGAIVANSMGDKDHGYIWLITKEEFNDFKLQLKFQSFRDSPGNSGVQVRSRYDKLAKVEGEEGLGYLDGPQVDVHPPGAWRTGFIYDETRGQRRWISPSLPDWRMDKETYAPQKHIHYFSDEAPYWNDLAIICDGNHIKTIVNGITVSDYDGTGILDDEHHQKAGIVGTGHIALQLHKDDELKIAFKDIMIKKL